MLQSAAILSLLLYHCVASSCGPVQKSTLSRPLIIPANGASPSPGPLTCEVKANEGSLASSAPSQCCCNVSGTWKCLPTVIIAGAQKSGSTALYGYLMLHPNFAPAKRKELHSFDNNIRWEQDTKTALQAYLLSFPDYNSTQVSKEKM